MKLFSPILLATPALGRQTTDETMHLVHKINVTTAFTLPPVNITEGIYAFSVAENGLKEGYHVNVQYEWPKVTKGVRNTIIGTTAGASVGALVGYMFTGIGATLGGIVGAVSLATFFLGITLFAKDSIRLVNVTTQEWYLFHTPTNIPGTFHLVNNQRDGGERRPLDAQMLGLNKPFGPYALRARLVGEPIYRLNPDEKIVVLQFIDLTTNAAYWVAKKGKRLVLSERKVTVFSFSPTKAESTTSSLRRIKHTL